MKMASSDVEVIGAIIDAKAESLKVYIDGRIVELENKLDARISAVERKVEVNAAKIDMLQHYQTVGFTIFVAMIGLAAMMLTLAPALLELFRDRRNRKSDDEVRSLIRDEFARLKGSPE